MRSSPSTRRLFAGGLVILALLAATPAWGASSRRPPSRPAPSPPSRLIPPDERARQLHAAMNLLDHDGKGYVTAADFARGRPFAGRLFAALDRDGNGTIERREFVAAGGALRASEFARLDRKKDGRVTLDEFRRGWTPDLFSALSQGGAFFTAGSLRPGFSTAVALPAPAPPPAAPPAAAPRAPWAGGVCWVPLLADGKHWALIFPWSPLCR